MRLRFAVVARLLVAVTLLAIIAPRAEAATPSPSAPCGAPGPAHYRHVVWIILENVGYSVVGTSNARYLNSLATRCALATNDHATSHPSLPNYVAMTSGSAQGITDDAEPSAHHLGVANIFSQLHSNWRALVESMAQPCDKTTSGTYAARHNPAVYYTNLASTCRRNDVAFTTPLNLNAAFTFISPNVCNDMHSCPVSTGDAWLARYVPMIISSAQYRSGSLALFITFDENDSSASNHIPTWIVAPTVPRGARVATTFTHYSLLATTERLLGLPLLGAARGARTLIGPLHL